MPITINGNGTVTGLSSVDLPAGTVTTEDIASAAVTPAKLSQPLTLATAQNTISGTSIDFTGIPSWVRRITVLFNGVSTNGTDRVMIQLGTSGGFVTTGYLGSSTYVGQAISATSLTNSSGLTIDAFNGPGNTRFGTATIANIQSNSWVSSSLIGLSDAAASGYGGGRIDLSGTLTQLRLTTTGGSNTFDAGSVNIMYEG
jgi:hypothetical protein